MYPRNFNGRRFACVAVILAVTSCAWFWKASSAITSSDGEKMGVFEIVPQSATVRRVTHDEAGSRVIVFELRNLTAESLFVRRVSASCGCTIPETWTNSLLAAGEIRPLRVQLAVPSYGKKKSFIQIVTNTKDGDATYEIPIEMEGLERDAPSFENLPESIEIRGYVGGGMVTREFEIETIEKPDSERWLIGLESADPDSAIATVTDVVLSESSGEVVRCRYQCRIDARIPDPIARQKLMLLTPTARIPGIAPLKQILVSLERQSELRCIPAALFFSREDMAKNRLERTVTLVSNSAEPFETQIEAIAPTWITLKPTQSEKSAVQSFQVEIVPSLFQKEITGTVQQRLTIRTSLVSTPSIELPVTVIVN